jgi:hypothetical protein
METLSKSEAEKRLDTIALDCESENYHSLAGMIWHSVVPMVQNVTERTVFIIPLEFGGIEKFAVEP